MNKQLKTSDKSSMYLRILGVVIMLSTLFGGLFVLNNYNISFERIEHEKADIITDYSELKDVTVKIRKEIMEDVNKEVELGKDMADDAVVSHFDSEVEEKIDSLMLFFPLKTMILPKVTKKELGYKNNEGLDMYEFFLVLNVPENRKEEIIKAEYYFEANGYPFKKRNRDRENNFRVSYVGWGCFTDVLITLWTSDEKRIYLHLNMCNGESW